VAFCRELGAHIAIDHRREDFVAAVLREVGAASVDAIIDFVQGEPGKRARPLLAVEGRHVLAGHAAGLIEIHPNEFYLQNWTLVGTCMGSGYGPEGLELEEAAHAHVMALFESGRYRPTTTRVIGMEEIPGALTDLEERRTRGRVVAVLG
jgi:NADPH:quinone reductase-like Zn-dependent oxidoreductase